MAYFDDTLIKSENTEQHRKHVREVFKRINEYSFKLGPENGKFFMDRMKYLGLIFDQKGRKPYPERAKAIKTVPSPDNVTKLQAFRGLASYYSIYIPKMYELRTPLNELLKKDKKWCWTKECKKPFQELKKCLQSDLALAHFDPKKELIVASDASNYRIETVLLYNLEDGSTISIAHAYRTLFPTERNYSQIEKESLSIIYAIKKFH